jgi:hypothetical protein
MPMLRFIAMVLVTASFALPRASAIAEPLDKESCLDLQGQRAKLLTPQMQAALDRGPDWVKDHLDSTDLEKVREFLSVEEKIEFRCRGGGVAKPVPSPAGAEVVPLPDRKPDTSSSTVSAGAPDSKAPDNNKTGSPPSSTADVKPSQTVADSDKTAPSKAKATR